MDTNSEEAQLAILDTVFPHFHDVGSFNVATIIPDGIDFNTGEGLLVPPEIIVSKLMTKYGYAMINDRYETSVSIELTEKGVRAKSVGGHFAYLKVVADEDAANTERQRRTDELSNFELLTKKYYYKARYLPHVFSALAVIGTVFSISIAYKPLNNKTDSEALKLSKQQPGKIDSLQPNTHKK